MGEIPARPQLDEAERDRRRQEIEDLIADAHAVAGRRIVATEILWDGTVVDYVEVSTVPGSGVGGPPPLEPAPMPPGVERAQLRELSGPPDAVAFIRPTFDSYVDGSLAADNLDEYLTRLPAGHPAELPSPNNNRLYVDSLSFVNNYGGSAQFNMFWDGVDVPTGSDFSLGEASFGCTTAGNSIGTVVGYVPGLGTGYRFQLERFVSGNQAWVTAANYNGFVPLAGVPFAPGMPINGPSEEDGYQGEIQMGTAYFGAFAQFPSAEWVAFNNTWVGYFPSSMFGLMGCSVEFYGEAFDASSSTTAWMNADMGSGNRPWSSSAYDNFQQAGYIRQPYYRKPLTDHRSAPGHVLT